MMLKIIDEYIDKNKNKNVNVNVLWLCERIDII